MPTNAQQCPEFCWKPNRLTVGKVARIRTKCTAGYTGRLRPAAEALCLGPAAIQRPPSLGRIGHSQVSPYEGAGDRGPGCRRSTALRGPSAHGDALRAAPHLPRAAWPRCGPGSPPQGPAASARCVSCPARRGHGGHHLGNSSQQLESAGGLDETSPLDPEDIEFSAGSRRALAQGCLQRPTLAAEPWVRFCVTKVDSRFTGRAQDPSGEPNVEAVPPRASHGKRAPHRRSGGPSQLQEDAANHRPSRSPPSSLFRTPTEPSFQGPHLGSYSPGTTSARGGTNGDAPRKCKNSLITLPTLPGHRWEGRAPHWGASQRDPAQPAHPPPPGTPSFFHPAPDPGTLREGRAVAPSAPSQPLTVSPLSHPASRWSLILPPLHSCVCGCA
ncbi:collagen alpha-1(XXVII) chain-like isoform X2 [Mesoplodon densirostris]|uniref:collagen alpha-1(XXVII) chain-like isoform X2 n=1 Tax=Mesoplodon densirostris TaxID=48708 RepID=UPI0028DC64A0|nr:collagen alpha-1(XXVII) chain-like isoform X2 [Mesoplodon densirostris]